MDNNSFLFFLNGWTSICSSQTRLFPSLEYIASFPPLPTTHSPFFNVRPADFQKITVKIRNCCEPLISGMCSTVKFAKSMTFSYLRDSTKSVDEIQYLVALGRLLCLLALDTQHVRLHPLQLLQPGVVVSFSTVQIWLHYISVCEGPN